jgi:hypothetical protein
VPAPAKTSTIVVLVVAVLAGLVVRAALLDIAPRWGFVGDHVDYVCWGRQTRAAGVLDLYRHGPGQCPSDVYINGRLQRLLTGTGERLNYPPLAAYAFAAQGRLLERLDPDAIANTRTARAVYATSTTVAELVAAVGVWTLVRAFASPLLAALAFAATWLAPPLLLDGPFWGQTESWVLAPVVWMVVAMIRERWIAAGVLYGVALALKPSALLFGPLWLYALAFRPARVHVIAGGVVALLVLNAFALPFWLDSGRSWLDRTYLENFVYDLQWTTAMTFNVWYVDLLATGILDPRVPLVGVTRDTWGLLMLVIGLAGAFALARRWERRNPDRARFGFVPLAALVTLAAVLLPTRVHSTYGAFTAPFLIATAFLVPRTTIGVVLCVVTMSLQILSWQWGTLLAMHAAGDESAFPPAVRARRQEMRAHDRPREWALTVANLAAAAAVAAGVAATRRRRDGRAPEPAA